MFEDDASSHASTVRHDNIRACEVRRIPAEIVIPGATSLVHGETGSRRPTSVEVPSCFALEKIPMSVISRSPSASQDDPMNGLPPASECNPMDGLGRDPVSAQINREHRERKATKSDTAPIPTYLWEEHLIEDAPTPWTDKQKEGLARAMNLARDVGLRWWKRAVYRGFMRWSSEHHKDQIQRAESWSAKRGPAVCWNASLRKYEWINRGEQSES